MDSIVDIFWVCSSIFIKYEIFLILLSNPQNTYCISALLEICQWFFTIFTAHMLTKQGKCVTLSNVFGHWFRYQSSCCFQQSGFITHPQISSTIIRELFIYSLAQFSVTYVVDWLSHKWVTQHVKQLIGFHRTWQSLVLDRYTCRDLKSFSYTQCCSFRHLLIFITVRLWFNNCVSTLIEFALELQCDQRRIRFVAELCVVWNFGHKICWNLKSWIENYGLEMCVKKYAIVLSSVCS